MLCLTTTDTFILSPLLDMSKLPYTLSVLLLSILSPLEAPYRLVNHQVYKINVSFNECVLWQVPYGPHELVDSAQHPSLSHQGAESPSCGAADAPSTQLVVLPGMTAKASWWNHLLLVSFLSGFDISFMCSLCTVIVL